LLQDELCLQWGALSAASFLLQALPLQTTRLPPRERFSLDVDAEEGEMVVWQFQVDYYDVGFSVTDTEGTVQALARWGQRGAFSIE
jgi:hypothetical protein